MGGGACEPGPPPMRVIAGSAKGRRLEVPKNWDGRPTLDRVREALFNILSPRLPGGRFLDLFAGTGANGIEALSRGAHHCTFVDHSPAAIAAITHNIECMGLHARAVCLRLALPDQLDRLNVPDAPDYNMIFADPPHNFDAYNTLVARIQECGLLAEEGIVIVEHAVGLSLDAAIGALRCWRRATYGRTCLSFFS